MPVALLELDAEGSTTVLDSGYGATCAFGAGAGANLIPTSGDQIPPPTDGMVAGGGMTFALVGWGAVSGSTGFVKDC